MHSRYFNRWIVTIVFIVIVVSGVIDAAIVSTNGSSYGLPPNMQTSCSGLPTTSGSCGCGSPEEVMYIGLNGETLNANPTSTQRCHDMLIHRFHIINGVSTYVATVNVYGCCRFWLFCRVIPAFLAGDLFCDRITILLMLPLCFFILPNSRWGLNMK
jgi:hypothetical protein